MKQSSWKIGPPNSAFDISRKVKKIDRNMLIITIAVNVIFMALFFITAIIIA